MIKKTVATAVAACLIVVSPGSGAYEAAAQVVAISGIQAPIQAAVAGAARGAARPGVAGFGTPDPYAPRIWAPQLPLPIPAPVNPAPAPRIRSPLPSAGPTLAAPGAAAPRAGVAAQPLAQARATGLAAAAADAAPKGRLAATSPFARAALSGAIERDSPESARLLAEPASAVPSAQELSSPADEAARGAADSAMSRVLGVRESRGEAAEASPVQGRLGNLPATLMADAPAQNDVPREASARFNPPSPAPSGGLQRPSLASRIFGGAGKAVWGALAALTFREALRAVFSGLALGPATLAFQVYSGALLFWSVLESITLHEVGHGWTAEKMGDVSPRMAGQLSANPARFTGPIGATILLLTSMLGFPMGGFATNAQNSFGDPKNRVAMAKVAIAGPLVNLAIAAAIVGVVIGVHFLAPGLALLPWAGGTLRVLSNAAFINVALGVMNLIPLGPLDGQKVLMGFIPERWHKTVQNATFWLGVGLLLLYVVGGLGYTTHKAVTQHGAGTPFGSTGDGMIMSLVANGVILWLVAVWPAVKKLWARGRKYLSDRRMLKAGGLSLMLAVPVLAGKVPYGSVRRESLAVPWSGSVEGRAGLAGISYAPAGVDEIAPGQAVARATDGAALAADERLIDDVRAGRLLLLKAAPKPDGDPGPGEPSFVAVPAEHLGGPAEVLAMAETAELAAIMGPAAHGRRLLTREQTELVVSLSKTLGTAVYELDYEGDPEHRAFLARTDNGPAFFVRYGVLEAIAAAEPGERAKARSALAAELSAMRERRGPAPAAAKPDPAVFAEKGADDVTRIPPAAAATGETRESGPIHWGNLKGAAKVGLVLAAATIALEILAPVIAAYFGWVPHPNYPGARAPVAGPLAQYLLSFFHGTVIAPILEEMIFRGGFMGLLTKAFAPAGKAAPWIAAVVSSLVFVMLHETADPVFFAVRLIGSLVISYAYIKHGIEASIAAHSLHNGYWQLLTMAKVFLAPWAGEASLALSAVYGFLAWKFWRHLKPAGKGGASEMKA